MATKREYRSEALGAIHETMAALESIGASNKITMREFDKACLQHVQELKPEVIRLEIAKPDPNVRIYRTSRWGVGRRGRRASRSLTP